MNKKKKKKKYTQVMDMDPIARIYSIAVEHGICFNKQTSFDSIFIFAYPNHFCSICSYAKVFARF